MKQEKTPKNSQKIATSAQWRGWLREVGQRIRLLRHTARLTQAGFARAVGLSSVDVVMRLERGQLAGYQADVLLPLLIWAAKQGTSADELLLGPESVSRLSDLEAIKRLIEEARADLAGQEVPPVPAPREPPPLESSWQVSLLEPRFRILEAEQLPTRWQGHYVPILGRIAAGRGVDTTEADAYLAFEGAPPSAFAVRLQGDSMAPQFSDGDLVIVDGANPASGGICAVIMGQPSGERIARVKRLSIHGRIARLDSLNPAYPPMQVPAAQVEAYAIWRHLPLLRRGG